MVIYFPVTALVTLFANILQNPQDTRSRSDLKLMNLVVNFLSMLSSDERNGSVKRMLNVCAEFERIAKNVTDKADREHASRRKRKQGDSEQDAEIEATANEILTPAYRAAQSPPQTNNASTPGQIPNADAYNPDFHGFNEVSVGLHDVKVFFTNISSPSPSPPTSPTPPSTTPPWPNSAPLPSPPKCSNNTVASPSAPPLPTWTPASAAWAV
jgi:hypothetical protein